MTAEPVTQSADRGSLSRSTRELRPASFSIERLNSADALRLGASEVVVSKDAAAMQKHAGSFDFILDTVSADHDIDAYINLLRRDGNLTLVGAPSKPLSVAAFGLLMRRRSLSGSLIGGQTVISADTTTFVTATANPARFAYPPGNAPGLSAIAQFLHDHKDDAQKQQNGA
jgi:NADPH:quinone reductase-like Zn-dependent oxidoreductase